RLAIDRMEIAVKVSQRFGRSQEQETARFEGVMKEGDDLPLQFWPQVDQQIAAANQVHTRKWRVFLHALHGKDDHLADLLADLVGAVIFDKEALQTFWRNVGGNVVRVYAKAGPLDGLVVDVGGENLHQVFLFAHGHLLTDEHGNRVGF